MTRIAAAALLLSWGHFGLNPHNEVIRSLDEQQTEALIRKWGWADKRGFAFTGATWAAPAHVNGVDLTFLGALSPQGALNPGNMDIRATLPLSKGATPDQTVAHLHQSERWASFSLSPDRKGASARLLIDLSMGVPEKRLKLQIAEFAKHIKHLQAAAEK